MCFNMNIVHNSNARLDVLNNYNGCKEYVDFETDALIVVLAMQYFGMKNLDAPCEEVIPPCILNASQQQKQNWIYDHVGKMLKQFVVGVSTETYESITTQIRNQQSNAQTSVFKCRFSDCNKTYRWKICFNFILTLLFKPV